MTARRALLDEASIDFDLPVRAARRALVDESALSVTSMDLSTADVARRAVDMSVPAVEQTIMDPIRLSVDNARVGSRARKLIATAATMAAAAVFVVPGALQVSSAADRPDAANATLPDRAANNISRSTERPLLEAAEASNERAIDDDTEARVVAAFEKKAADDKAAEEAAAEERASNERATQNNASQASSQAAATAANYEAPPASGAAGAALAFAMAQAGKPYIWGGTGPAGYDCSGLVFAAYRSAGVSLPRTASAMAGAGVAVSPSDLQPGDIIVSYGGGHAAIYVGNGMVIEALNPGVPIGVNRMSGGITAARRIV